MLLTLGPTLLRACQEDGHTTQLDRDRPASQAIIYGNVVAAANQQPIPNATINLILLKDETHEQHEFTSNSGSDGTFYFRQAPAGRYLLFAEASGFLRGMYTEGLHKRTPAFITVDQDTTVSLTLALVEEGVISGRVSDKEGRPVVGMSVRGWKLTTSFGKAELIAPSPDATSDKDGRYILPSLDAGTYYISTHNGSPALKASDNGQLPSPSMMTTYFPSASLEEAIPVAVRPGMPNSDINIVMRTAELHHLRGSVTLSTPKNAFVRLSMDDGISTATVETVAPVRRDNAFDIAGVAPGRYLIELTSSVDGPTLDSQHVAIGAKDQNEIVLEEQTLVTVSGQIALHNQQIPNGWRILLSPVDRKASGRPPALGMVKTDGTFTIADIYPGAYLVRLLGETNGIYIKELNLGHHRVDGRRITITAHEPLDVVLESVTNEIEGTVDLAALIDKSKSGNFTVLGISDSEDYDASSIRVSPVDANGSYHLRNVKPGKTKLFAAPVSVPQDAWLNQQFLLRMADADKVAILDVPQFGNIRAPQLKTINFDEAQEACLQLGIDMYY